MRELLLQPYGKLVLLIVLLGGCSSYHNVSIMGSGHEKDERNLKPIDSPSGPVTSPLLDIDSSVPDGPQISTPNNIAPLESDSAAQSADDSILPWTLEDVFFDYDQYTIRREAISVLEQNANVLLKRYPNREVLIEGHCDERGTEDYNLILGNRRATVVKNYLVDLGVPASNLQVLSLGKSEPFCLQSTRQCLQQNRRAHFILK